MKLYTIDFDMDHVLTDFSKAYEEGFLEKQQFPQADSFFFHDMPPLKSVGTGKVTIDNYIFTKSLIDLGHTIRIVTAPSLPNLNCWTGKAYWIKKYFGEELLSNLIITYDKSPLSTSGDILVDDGVANGQTAYGDRHLLYGSEEFSTMRKVYDQIVKWSDEGKEFPIEQKLEDYKEYLEKIKQ